MNRITLQEYNGHKDYVHIDGRPIKHQTFDGVIVSGNIVIVRIMHDDRIDDCEDYKSVPCQLHEPIEVVDNGIKCVVLFLEMHDSASRKDYYIKRGAAQILARVMKKFSEKP